MPRTVKILQTSVTPTLPKGMGAGNTPTVVAVDVEWAVTGETLSPTDWIGMVEKGQDFSGATSQGQTQYWFYLGRPTGKRRVNIPAYGNGESYGGEYEAVMFANDGREEIARSQAVNVQKYQPAAA